MVETVALAATEASISIATETAVSEVACEASVLSETVSAVENGLSAEAFTKQVEAVLANPEYVNELKNSINEADTILQDTGWSPEITDQINSLQESNIYKEANLHEATINDRKCLIRNDIEWEQSDSMGRTNIQRAEAGLSPISKDGEIIELHHIGQKNDAPLAELTPIEHRGKDNYSILHDTKKESEINRFEFVNERSEHWKHRANLGGIYV